MDSKKYLSFVVSSAFLFDACCDQNSSIDFSENTSSSVIVDISSSLDILSSSVEIESSSSEFSSSSLEQSSSSIYVSHGLMTDERDGQVYKTVTIGNQTWMAENLNYAYTQPINGLDSSSWCNNNDPENCTKYGRLYTWAAAVDSIAYFKEENDNCLKSCTLDCEECGSYVNWQIGEDFWKFENFNLHGVCPENWHIPSVNEWYALLDRVNTIDLKSTSGWLDDGNGTDIYGFRVLPAGANIKDYKNIGDATCFWTPLQYTSVIDGPESAALYKFAGVFCFSSKSMEAVYEGADKTSALSVRCVKDTSNSEEYLKSIFP